LSETTFLTRVVLRNCARPQEAARCSPTTIWLAALVVAGMAAGIRSSAQEGAAPWTEAARRTHVRFTGRPGTFAQFGDSITVTQAFWSPLRYERRNAPPALDAAFRRVSAAIRPECWGEWKGAEFGSEGGQTVRWADANVDRWLAKLNPEAAVMLFGSNDLHSLELEEYRAKLRSVSERCQKAGTVLILTTPPPRHGFERKAAQFAEAVRDLAGELKLPLIDFHAEILKRRPADWDGALDAFKTYEGYDVPTLISRDGVHPSYPKRFQNDYSEEGLRSSGYTLRNYLTLLKYAEVLVALQAAPAPGPEDKKAAGGPPSRPWYPKAPRLPPPAGEVIRVSNVTQLYDAAARVSPGGTIALAAGRYVLPRTLEIRRDGVTLRGEPGDRDRVVLDGPGNAAGAPGEAVRVRTCSGVTIADLTVENVRWNGIKIDSDTGVQRLRIYNCVLHNVWQRAIKGVKVPAVDRERLRPRDCRIEFCLFYNDRPKQYSDDPADTERTFRGDYVGGIDVMYPAGWTIADNVFVGIQGRTRQARGAVFLWQEARDCVVERNVIVDCDSGICLGNSQPPDPGALHCTGTIVRNNIITRAPENGILADYTRDCKILHNTVYDADSRLRRGIRMVHDNDGLLVAHNLLSGPSLLSETSSGVTLRSNPAGVPPGLFVAPAEGNLRLARPEPGVADAGVLLREVTDDLDRRRRGRKPDLGAHEVSAD